MSRARISKGDFVANVERAAAAASLDAMIGDGKKKGGSASAAQVKRAVDDARRRVAEKDWMAATPTVLVALYALCHEEVYGVGPAELVGKVWSEACRAAGGMVKRDFDGSSKMAVDFLQWTWTREARREQWRREHDRTGWRLTWRSQFSKRDLLADYRTELARKRRR